MFEQITIEGKKYNLVLAEEQERILICEIDGKKYYLGPEADKEMSWYEAKDWAASIGGQLMPREVGVIAFKKPDIRRHFQKRKWYWCAEESSLCSSNAWLQHFYNGVQYSYDKTYAYSVRAVFVENS